MLVLSRKADQEIKIGDNITVRILGVKGNTVRIGFEAPKEVDIVRGELLLSSMDDAEIGSSSNDLRIRRTDEYRGSLQKAAHSKSNSKMVQNRNGNPRGVVPEVATLPLSSLLPIR